MFKWNLPRALLAGMVTVVLGVFSCATVVRLVVRSYDEFAVTHVVRAPDGVKQAVLLDGMGGGAAGWCSRYVIVEPASETPPNPTTLAKKRGRAVLAGDCSLRVALTWRGPAELLLRYTRTEGSQVIQRHERSGVRVSYELLTGTDTATTR